MKTLKIFSLTLLLLAFVSAKNDPTCVTKGPTNPPDQNGFLRIVNGQDATPHEFPWQCSLRKCTHNE